MEQTKKYFAFISYKREDERWAKWLQHKLEHYHLPTNVRKENPALPQSIRPVFKDTSELAAGVLADEINEALDNSKYLIVICSPRAAQSKWVGKEVQAFIDMGRSDKIIPFIIGGKPFSENPEEECFPSALLNLPKEQELLGVNINEMGRDAAVVKVVARMFGLKFDTLWQRYEREQKRKRWMWIAGSILLALLGLSIGGYFVRQNGIIERQNERLQQDSITMANHLLRILNDSIKMSIQNDSISFQNYLISNQRDSLNFTTKQLLLSNKLLAEERDNVLRANWKFMENRAKYMAEKIRELTEEGDVYTAIQLSLEVLPKDLSNPEIPYEPMVESAFRAAVEKWERQSYCPITIFEGHDASVKTVALSPNGKYAATGSNDCTIKIWDLTTGVNLKTLLGHVGPISSIDYDSTGNYLVSASEDSTLRVWDVTYGKEIAQLEYNAGFTTVETVRFGRTDSNVVFSMENKAINWNYKANKIEDIYGCEWSVSPVVHAASYSKDGNLFLMAGDDSKIHVYSTDTRKEIQRIDGDSCKPVFWWIRGTEFSPDGKMVVAGSYDNSVRVWDVITGKEIFKKWHTKTSDGLGFVYSVQFSNDGNFLVSGGFDGVINIWDVTKGELIASLKGKEKNIWDMRLSKDDSYLISTYWKNKAILYRLFNKDVTSQNIIISHNEFPFLAQKWPEQAGEANFIEDGCYSHSGDIIATAARDDRIRLWKSQNGELLKEFSFENFLKENKEIHYIPYPGCITFSPDDKYILIGNWKGQLFIMDSETGHIENVIVNSMDDKEAKPSFGNTAADVQSNDISCIRYNSYGDLFLFSSHDFYTHIYDTKTLKPVLNLDGHLAPVNNLTFDKEGKYIITCSRDKTIRIWDYRGIQIKTLAGHRNEVNAVACSPTQDVIVSVSDDRTMRIWNMRGEQIHEPISFEMTPVAICFSPDGEYLACADETTIHIYETQNYNEIHQLAGHTFTITSVSFRPDGRQIMSTANDGTCRLWDFSPLPLLKEEVIRKYNIIPLTTYKKQQLLFE